jgi:peptide-methionine (S)-S-oxide reductase
MRRAAVVVVGVALALAACEQTAQAGEATASAPVPALKAHEKPGLKTAIFAGGCFWGVEAVFSHVKGVKSAVSGHEGGAKADADYESVSTGRTGMAESVKVTYDPSQVRYDQLLQVFFSVVADPTLRNRQGPDSGTQYRSALVPLNAEQRTVASAYLAQMGKSGVWKAPIATRIEPFKGFYPAEGYHQDFALKNPDNAYIVHWDAPKVRALKAAYPGLYSAAFVKG